MKLKCSSFSTPRTFHTPHFPHSTFSTHRTPRFPPNRTKAITNCYCELLTEGAITGDILPIYALHGVFLWSFEASSTNRPVYLRRVVQHLIPMEVKCLKEIAGREDSLPGTRVNDSQRPRRNATVVGEINRREMNINWLVYIFFFIESFSRCE